MRSEAYKQAASELSSVHQTGPKVDGFFCVRNLLPAHPSRGLIAATDMAFAFGSRHQLHGKTSVSIGEKVPLLSAYAFGISANHHGHTPPLTCACPGYVFIAKVYCPIRLPCSISTMRRSSGLTEGTVGETPWPKESCCVHGACFSGSPVAPASTNERQEQQARATLALWPWTPCVSNA